MKKVIVAIIAFVFTSCSPSVEDIAAFEFNGAWYWVLQTNNDTPEAEIKEKIKQLSSKKQTAHFFVFSDTIDLSVLKENKFDFERFSSTIIEGKPERSYTKMSNSNDITEDALWLLKQANK